MKIFYLEDHGFYAVDIIKFLKMKGHEVVWCDNYYDSINILEENKFDCSILDIILQNGKTGLQLASEHKQNLGRVMFLTGCVDKSTLDNVVSLYPTANKIIRSLEKVNEFINGGYPKINNEEDILKLATSSI